MKARFLKSVRTGALAALTAALSMAATSAPASGQNVIRDSEIEETLRIYTDPLLRAAGVVPEDVSLYLIDDDSLNAGVTGGQNILINTGLIMAADNPNEIMGVLAHEVGHIAGGHLARSREAMNQSMRPAFISLGLGVLAIAAGAPDAGAALISGAGTFAQGNFVRHTQVQESAADQAAAGYLESTGQSGRGLVSFFGNLRRYEFQVRNLPPYVLSHPFSSDRMEALRQRVQTSPHYAADDTADNLRRFEFMQAKLVGFTRSRGQTLARYPLTDTSQPARYARAVAYYRASELPEARAELNSLLEESPDNPFYHELMGQILFENGRAEEALPYHRRALELEPNDALLLTNLARSLTSARRRAGAEEAVALLTRATQIEPDNAFAWRELAQARELMGQRGLAELASAEQNYAMRNYPAAVSFAERARRTLEQNTPSYQRASDIAIFAGEEVREIEERERRS
ncbi:MAG: M48 family metalloprotease [Hyphomonadaceae bacterium]